MIDRERLARAQWLKSSRSGSGGTGGGDCVEMTVLDGRCIVRDSKDPEGPILIFGAAMWHTLTQQVKAGEYDQA